MLARRFKPYRLPEMKVALRAIGRPLPYLSQLRRRDVISEIPLWLTSKDIERLVSELARRRKESQGP